MVPAQSASPMDPPGQHEAVPVSVHSAMCVCLPVHIVYLYYLTLLLPTQYTGLPPPQNMYYHWQLEGFLTHRASY